jgi:hypothetical protein
MDVTSTLVVVVIIAVAAIVAIVAYLWYALKIVEQDLEGY